jgi:hypothetical protein
VTNTLTEAMTALTGAGWAAVTMRQTGDDWPDYPDDLDISYISVSAPGTDHVVEIFMSTCDCPEDTERDEAAHLGGAVAGNGGPPGRGFMVVYLDSDGVDEVAEDHVTPAELPDYARFWLGDFPGAEISEVRK